MVHMQLAEMTLQEIMKELSLEEKAQLVYGGGIYTTKSVKRLGIPSALLMDSGCGVNLRQYLEALYNLEVIHDDTEKENNETEGIGTMARFGNIAANICERENLNKKDSALLDACMEHIEKQIGEKAFPTCFPANTLLAATWNREAVYENAAAVGKEASAYGLDMLLSPSINIQRDPRGGRNFEYYSEDPYLTGELAAEYCRGVQAQGVLANAKHFAANSQETERMRINEIIPERALQEIYLPAFKKCVQKGGVQSVMSSYNWVNGYPCAQNEWLLKDVLRNEWGFEGTVVSDWRAAYDLPKAIKAGNDLAMPGPRDYQEILDAIEEGNLSEEDLDLAVKHILMMLTKMPSVTGRRYSSVDFDKSAKTAYQTALEGITLLKNKNRVLPLTEKMRVAVFGEKAEQFIESGIGSGHVFTDRTTSLVECIRSIVGSEHIAVGEITKDTQAVIVVVSTDGQEGGDCVDMHLKSQDRKLIGESLHKAKAMGIPVILIMNVAAPVELTDFIEELDACLDVYYPGQEGARAAADILFGKANPCGKLPHTYPKHYYDCPSFGNFPGYNEQVYYGEGIYVGYRWYDTRHIEPLFPFGFGLSYTEFEFGEAVLDKSVLKIDEDEKIQVRVKITNIGGCAGKEVVQLYVKDVTSTLDRPEKELKGFEKIFLQPGESKEVCFSLAKDDLAAYDTKYHKWICESGDFEILIGNSSADIRSKALFRAEGFNPYSYNEETPITKLSLDARAVRIILNQMQGYITEKEFYNVAYFGQRHNLKVVWNTMLSGFIKEDEEVKERIYRCILKELSELDASAAKLVEKFVF